MIEEAFGYTGSSRFVAFHWTPKPAGLVWCDPHESSLSSYEHVWQAFAEHGRVQPFLEHLNLGNGDSEAQQWLVLDRVRRQFLSGDAPKVAAFLRSVPHDILSAETDGADLEHLTVMQSAMSALVRSWLDEEDG
jgi:hypothetical protein